MSENVVKRFKDALQRSEAERDAGHVAELFVEGAPLSNLGGDQINNAAEFWGKYLDQFREIRSEFTSEISSERGAALEWQSRGDSKDGKSIEYRGVSLIEFHGDKLTSFRAYYDSAAFVRS